MTKTKFKSFNKMMIRVKDIEKLMLFPNVDKILDFKDMMKLEEERKWLLNTIWRYFPCNCYH